MIENTVENKNEIPDNKMEMTIINPELTEMSSEFAELGLDSFLDDGILKDVPVVSTLVGIYKVGSKISAYYITKKLYKFLFELKSVKLTDRLQKIREINESGKNASSVGEKLLEILDHLESDHKPEMIGRLFRGVLKGELHYSQFLKISHVIRNTYVEDLLWIKANSDKNFIRANYGESVILTGLVNMSKRKANLPEGFKLELPNGHAYLTQTGQFFRRYAFD